MLLLALSLITSCLGGTCEIGTMICKSPTTYASCTSYIGGLAYEPEQSCPSEFFCESFGSFIYCVTRPGCTIGSSICRSVSTFSVCTNNSVIPIYAAELACDKGLVCQQIKNNAQCADPLLCTVGNMICKSRTTYSTCVTYTGIPSFGPEQSCPEGLVCQPSGNFVHCVSAWPSSSLCTVGTMICTSETTYATCSNHLGLPSYFPEQSCPFGLVCSPVGNEIYCVHSTATLTLTQTPAVSPYSALIPLLPNVFENCWKFVYF
eukprot:TRINITY_DN5427_c0_g1_i5.p2 TRINITY_DN5427_c0_g1~~TRINITY_DN5427_c0_g1_i5.p2  ORF type:complete len:262 (+),score=17.13 TRINITY_DN5427_c0_g1_i5:325-1110(+)